jgi:hypothetical protein
VVSYRDEDDLAGLLDDQVIAPAEAMAAAQRTGPFTANSG